MTATLTLVLVPAVAVALTALLTPVVRGAAIAAGRVAPVQVDRWHRKPTATLGGVAIFLGFGLAVVVGAALAPGTADALESGRPGPLPLSHWQALIAAGSLAFLLGMIDDLIHLRPVSKLAGQLAAATVLVTSGIGVWLTGIYAVDVGISLFWFVGLTNALNLLDNMDGLASGTGAIAAGILAALFLMNGQAGLATLALALAGALVGFLAHNYPPARIFMGDSGSLFLGIFLAGLALAPAPGLSRGLFAVMAVPVLVLSIPILDTTLVTLGRFLEGRSIVEGGRDHASHRLAALGLGEERAVWTLWILALTGGVVGLLLRTAERALAGVLGGVLLLVLALVGAYLLVERRGDEEAGAGTAAEESGAASLYDRVLAFHRRIPFLAFGLDVMLVGLAYYAAYLIRWDPGQLQGEMAYFQSSLPVVVTAKIVAFAWVGIYGARWRHFGIEEALRVLRANLFGTILVAASLLLLQRVGLSRGVLIVDFFVSSALIAGSRFSFRLLEGMTWRFSEEGEAVIVLGPPADAELALHELRLRDRPRLRPVAIVDGGYGPARGRFRGFPVYGGRHGLSEAVEETGVHAVVLVDRRGAGTAILEGIRQHLESEGALDVYALRVSVERLEGGAGPR